MPLLGRPESIRIMGVLRSDYPIATITIQRWQKDWLVSQASINFSGLVQEMLTELIKVRDPAFYSMHIQESESNVIQRKDMMRAIVRNSSKY